MVSVFERLYDDYKSYTIIPEMGIHGYCGKKRPRSYNCDEFRPNVIFSSSFSDIKHQNEIAFIDKIVPHSILDCMLMSMESSTLAVTDLSTDAINYIFNTAYSFIKFISDPDVINKYKLQDGHMHICFNYDPYTQDRESGMSEKRFHIHMNYWRKGEIDFKQSIHVESLPNFSQIKRVIDPLSIIGENILYDLFRKEDICGKILKPDAKRDADIGLPVGLKISFDECSVLKENSFAENIKKMHSLMQKAYEELENIFCHDKIKDKKWKRSILNNSQDIKRDMNKLGWLSEYSKALLCFLADHLRNINDIPADLFISDKRMRTEHLCMNGLCYALSFFTPSSNKKTDRIIDKKSFYLVIQPKMFSDIGGAGLPPIGGVAAVRLRRNAVEFSDVELAEREAFHTDFLRFLGYEI